MSLQNLLIDKRIVQRNIEQGKLEVAEFQRILDALPDLADKVWRRPAATEPAPVPPQAPVPAPVPVTEATGSVASADTASRAAEVVSDAATAPRLEAAPAFDAGM